MKKIFFLLVICMFLFSGCSNRESVESEASEVVPYSEQWINLKIKEQGLDGYQIAQSVKGRFDDSSSVESRAHLLKQKVDTDKIEVYNSYLAVESKSKVLFKKLPDCMGNGIEIADIDGNGKDEIIVQNTIGASGGVGQFASYIFEVNDNIDEIFYSANTSPFDTGFEVVFDDNSPIVIKNVFTGYEKALDNSKEKDLNIFFDEEGKVIKTEDISCDSFYRFYPKDVDDDGVYEIVAVQYVSLYGHSDGIGFAESVLRYNTATKQFDVVDTRFTNAIENDLFAPNF